MTPLQLKAIAGVIISICTLVSAYYPEFATTMTMLGGTIGMVAPALFSKK